MSLRARRTDDVVRAALAHLTAGGMVVVADDKDRENEGDLICAAQHMTERTMAFYLRHGSGIVCAPCRSNERRSSIYR